MLPAIEVVIINWKRPENVARIIEALKSQTVPCTITVCDCHNQPEFSLKEDVLYLIDRIFKWDRNTGPFSRYVPLASYDHFFTMFIDDDILPGKRCLEAFLKAASEKPDFGVFGQMGRILGNEGSYNIFSTPLGSPGEFVEVDFIIRAYFVKTRHLHNLVKFRWQIGYFEEIRLQDDLLMCAAMKYYENLGCFLIPENEDRETLVNKEELDPEHAFSSSVDHFTNRQNFIDRIRYHGWEPINQLKHDGIASRQGTESIDSPPKVSICLIISNDAEDLNAGLARVYDWDCCHEILVISNTSLNNAKDCLDPDKKLRFISAASASSIEFRNRCAKEITGTHLLILDSYEIYSKNDLRLLKEDIMTNPEADLFKFDFSHNPSRRNYFYLWHGTDSHIIGAYWDIPQHRVYKWITGTKFTVNNGNNPVRLHGRVLDHPSAFIKITTTRARCVNTRYADLIPPQSSENIFYEINTDDSDDLKLQRLKQMRIDCEQCYGNWSQGSPIPVGAQILPFAFDNFCHISETH